jgi:hypothetical protein
MNKRSSHNRTPYKIEQQIVSLYQKGMSPTNIAKQFGMWQTTVHNIVKRSGIKMRTMSEANTRYLRDEHVFDEINTEEAAYWLGFIAADGTVRKDSLKITLLSIDIDHLKKFGTWISPTRPISIETMKGRTTTSCTIKIGSQYLVQQIATFGVVPDKTHTMKSLPILHQHPFLHDLLMRHYLRGFFDGDGHISKMHIPSNRRRIEITAYHKELLSEIQEWFIRATGVEPVSILHNHNRAWRYIKSGDEIKKILRYLYGNATIYLDRKYELAMNILRTDTSYVEWRKQQEAIHTLLGVSEILPPL